MKLVRNAGNDRVIDLIRPSLGAGQKLDVVTSVLSLFAFAELLEPLESLDHCRLMLPPDDVNLALFGSRRIVPLAIGCTPAGSRVV